MPGSPLNPTLVPFTISDLEPYTINNNGYIGGVAIDGRYDYAGFTFKDNQFAIYMPVGNPINFNWTVWDINNFNLICGTADYQGWIRSNDHDDFFQHPNGITMGTTFTAINSANQVVGYYQEEVTYQNHSFIWIDGDYVDLVIPAGLTVTTVIAKGINDAGVITGYYYDGDNAIHGFAIVGGTNFTTVDHPSQVNGTYLNKVNNNNIAVGYYADASMYGQGFIYDLTNQTFAGITISGDCISSKAEGINDSNDVVGTYFDSNFTYYSFVQDGGGGNGSQINYPTIVVLNGGELGDTYSVATSTVFFCINDNGDTVGTLGDPVVYLQNGKPLQVAGFTAYGVDSWSVHATFGGSRIAPDFNTGLFTGINNSGARTWMSSSMQGWYSDTSNPSTTDHSYFVAAANAYTEIAETGYNVYAFGLNDLGVVVGTKFFWGTIVEFEGDPPVEVDYGGCNSYGFTWTAEGGMHTITIPLNEGLTVAMQAWALGINNAGVVVGMYRTDGTQLSGPGGLSGFIVDGAAVTIVDYPPVGFVEGNSFWTELSSINDNGVIVGRSWTVGGPDIGYGIPESPRFVLRNGDISAFIRQADGSFVPFNIENATCVTPLSINNDNVITGYYVPLYSRSPQGFVATPTAPGSTIYTVVDTTYSDAGPLHHLVNPLIAGVTTTSGEDSPSVTCEVDDVLSMTQTIYEPTVSAGDPVGDLVSVLSPADIVSIIFGSYEPDVEAIMNVASVAELVSLVLSVYDSSAEGHVIAFPDTASLEFTIQEPTEVGEFSNTISPDTLSLAFTAQPVTVVEGFGPVVILNTIHLMVRRHVVTIAGDIIGGHEPPSGDGIAMDISMDL